MTEPPWRCSRASHFTGIPAWGIPQGRALPPFNISAFTGVSRRWALEGGYGAGVRVCILDSGVDDSHPLVGAVESKLEVSRATDGSLEIVGTDIGDLIGHGTACAGVIKSLAPHARISSVRVLTDGISGSGAGLLAGLRWAIEEGFDIINLSLATTRREYLAALYELADLAYFRRTLLVASAHNMPVQSFPWMFSSVISVACHSEPDKLAFYYNPNPPVEFYAHGVRVTVPWAGGGEREVTGNSFAAPHITGVCAKILSKHPWLTPSQLKTVLYLTARNVTPDGDTDANT